MKELVTFGLKVLSDECDWGSRFSNVAVYVGDKKVKYGRYVRGCEHELKGEDELARQYFEKLTGKKPEEYNS
jgi:hypothetical protein